MVFLTPGGFKTKTYNGLRLKSYHATHAGNSVFPSGRSLRGNVFKTLTKVTGSKYPVTLGYK